MTGFNDALDGVNESIILEKIEAAFLSALQTGFDAGMDYATNGSKNPANYEHPWEQYKKENNL